MVNLNYISVAGYGSTGSSAVVDVLKETSDCEVIGGEFRFIQDPDGLEDLCFNLKNSWGWVRSDAFIRRFIKYTDIIGRNPHYFQFGENLDSTFNGKFFKYRNDFLDSIIDSKWNGYWFYHDYHERSPLQAFIERSKRYLRNFGVKKSFIRRITKKSEMFFVRSDEDVYTAAKVFVNNLFGEYIKEKSTSNIVLDQLILPYNRHKFELLFDGLKQIIVDRDPRDVYLDAMSYNAYPITDDVNTFISFYESSRSLNDSRHEDENLLFIRFEDLIYNYDSEVKKIKDFLKLDFECHDKKYKFFDPRKSVKNTRTWEKEENLKYISDIRQIEDKLKNYCYPFSPDGK